MIHNPAQLRYQHLARMATYCNHAVLSFQARNWTYPELGCLSNVSAKRSAMTPRKHSEKQDNCIINFHILHPVPFNVKFLLPPQESFHVLSTPKRTIFRNMQTSSKMHDKELCIPSIYKNSAYEMQMQARFKKCFIPHLSSIEKAFLQSSLQRGQGSFRPFLHCFGCLSCGAKASRLLGRALNFGALHCGY